MNELIPQMEAAAYHSSAGISKHGLDLIRHAPSLYLHRKNNPEEQTPAMRWGTLAHTVILEPDKFDDEVFVLPPCDRRTKEGKETYAQAMREAAGRTIITLDEAQQLEGMKDAFYADKACRNAVQNIEYVEASLYWIDQVQDVQCRARMDAIRKDGVIVDYKTTDNASPAAFLRSVMSFRYHVQAAFYLDSLKAVTGQDGTFLLVAQATRRQQHIRKPEDGVQWGPQLMADRRQETVLQPIALVKGQVSLGQLVDLGIQLQVRTLQLVLHGNQGPQHAVESMAQVLEFIPGLDLAAHIQLPRGDRVTDLLEVLDRLDDHIPDNEIGTGHDQQGGCQCGADEDGPIKVHLAFQ